MSTDEPQTQGNRGFSFLSLSTSSGMKYRMHWGISGIVAKNIRQAREQRGLTRADLANWLNSGLQAPNDPPKGAGAKPWAADLIVPLEHGHKGRTPPLGVDDIFALSRAMDVPLYELLLPDSSNILYGMISAAIFGFEVTENTISGLRWRSEHDSRFRDHPEVVEAALPDELTWWRLNALTTEAGDTDDAQQLREEANEAAVRKDEISRLKIESLLFRLRKGEISEPSNDQVRTWFLEHHQRLADGLGWIGGEQS